MVTVRHGDEFVPATDVAALPVPALALRLLMALEQRRTAHVPRVRFTLDSIEGSALVRWEEDRVPNAGALGLRLSDALGWLISQALVVPTGYQGEWRVSELGRRVAAERDLAGLQAEQRLAVDLHRLLANARSVFSLGTYDAAVLEAMKQVEERVRDLAGLSGSGADLMRRAFSPGGKPGGAPGPLADPAAADPNENRGVMELFAGAMAAFRNPAAHRSVDYEDPTEAAEVVLLADLLLRILDRIERRVGRGPAAS